MSDITDISDQTLRYRVAGELIDSPRAMQVIADYAAMHDRSIGSVLTEVAQDTFNWIRNGRQ